MDHDTIRDALERAFPARLIAPYHDEGLRLPGGRAHVFLPDCHLMTEADDAVYKRNHCVLTEQLTAVLEQLRDLKTEHRGELTVWHLGDLMDVWRCRSGTDDQSRVDAISADRAAIIDLLRNPPPDGVRAELIAGNHDYVLHDLDEWLAARFRIIENEDLAGGDTLVMHGDLFVWLETFASDDLQAFIVRLAKWVMAGRHAIGNEQQRVVSQLNQTLPLGDKPIGVSRAELGEVETDAEPPDIYNVVDFDRGPKGGGRKQFFVPGRELAIELKKHGHDIRTIIVGHTHWARLIVGEREPGIPFAVMDCGAWIGDCSLEASAADFIPSAQVGAVVGSDLRIYQMMTS